MKILVVVPDLNIGGVTTSARNFCIECSRRGNKVDILVMNGSTANIPNIKELELSGRSKYWNLGIDDLKIQLRAGNFGRFALLSCYAVYKKLTNKKGKWLTYIFKNCLATEQYDVAIAYRQCAPCYYYTLNCVKATKKIAMIHGNLNFMNETSSWDKMLVSFNRIACVSKAVTNDFKRRYDDIADRFTTIYNMFNISEMLRKSGAKCDYNVNHSLVNIISVTRHDNGHKKTDRIVEAAYELKSRGIDNFHWYIVGDGPDMDKNKNLAKKFKIENLITFCGALENPYALQAQCDFSVLTSITEAFSMSVIESQILGKPIIAMHYSGIEEAIQDRINGLISLQTIDNLCDLLQEAITKPESLKNIRRNLQENPYSNDIPYSQFLECANS